jgi:hypothetical protein
MFYYIFGSIEIGNYTWYRIIESHKLAEDNFCWRIVFADTIDTVYNLLTYNQMHIDTTISCHNINRTILGLDPFGNNFFLEYMEPYNDLIHTAFRGLQEERYITGFYHPSSPFPGQPPHPYEYQSENTELNNIIFRQYGKWAKENISQYVYIYFK